MSNLSNLSSFKQWLFFADIDPEIREEIDEYDTDDQKSYLRDKPTTTIDICYDHNWTVANNNELIAMKDKADGSYLEFKFKITGKGPFK
jgi:hypothetical protein